MFRIFKEISKNERGATAIEYGLIAGGIAMVIIVGVTLIGADLQGLFQGLADAM
ncbi:MAG: Flp family type IVb pilin [Pseudomonadota bacterium]